MLVGDVREAERLAVDQFDQPVDALGGGVWQAAQDGVGDLLAPGGDGLGECDDLGNVLADGGAVAEEPGQGVADL